MPRHRSPASHQKCCSRKRELWPVFTLGSKSILRLGVEGELRELRLGLISRMILLLVGGR